MHFNVLEVGLLLHFDHLLLLDLSLEILPESNLVHCVLTEAHFLSKILDSVPILIVEFDFFVLSSILHHLLHLGAAVVLAEILRDSLSLLDDLGRLDSFFDSLFDEES